MAYIGKQPTKAALTASDIEDGIITAAKIEDGAVVAAEIASNAVTTAKINADAVTGAKIADDAINSEHYTDGSVDTAHIADANVTSAKIAGDAITAAKIADDAISEEHLDVTAITGHTAETSIADGDTILIHDASASALRKMTKANFVSGIGGTNTPAFSVGKSGDQSIDNSETMTKVTWDTEHLDSDNTFASDKFTPAVAGEYFISFNFRVQNNGDNEVNIIVAKIYKNGSVLHNTDSRVDFRSNKGRGAGITCTVLVNLDTDDYIEFYGGNNAAGGTSTIQYRGTLAQGFRIIT